MVSGCLQKGLCKGYVRICKDVGLCFPGYVTDMLGYVSM